MVNNYCRTYTGDDSDITATTSTTMNDGVYEITITYTDEHTYTRLNPEFLEKLIYAQLLTETREGWLKPHKKFKPLNLHSKITYNLPRNRIREKKQIFRQAA